MFRYAVYLLLLLLMYSVRHVFALHPMSLFPVLAAAAAALLLPRAKEAKKCFRRAGAVLGCLFGFFTAAENYTNYLSYNFPVFILRVLLYTAGLGTGFSILLTALFSAMERAQIRKGLGVRPFRSVFLSSFFGILLVWTPFFLIHYPGIFTDDSLWQLQQALGDAALSNHHPVAHTLLLRLLCKAGEILFSGDLTKTVAMMSVFQMVFLSACWSFGIAKLYRMRFKPVFTVGTFVFFAIAPYNIVFSYTNIKDSWFAGFFFVFTVLLLELFLDVSDEACRNVSDRVLLLLSAAGIGLLRSNGFYVLLVMLPVLLYPLWKRRSFLVLIAIAVLFCFLILGPLYRSLEVTPVDTVEYLSVPLQQIGRIYADGGTVDADDEELIAKVVNPALIASTYYARISDNMKNLIRNAGDQSVIGENPGVYLSMWLRLLAKHPVSCLAAYADLTSGFWYPESYGIPYVDNMVDNPYKLKTKCLLPSSVAELSYLWTHSNVQRSDLGILFSCGYYVWLVLILFAYCCAQRSKLALTVLPSVLLWGTLLLTTPVYGDLRYLYALAVCVPLYLAAASRAGKES